MPITRAGKKLIAVMDKSIGEGAALFTYKLDGIEEIQMDMAQVAYMNSVGVKNWIMWTVKIPPACKIFIHKTPYLIVSQASTVLGFYTPQMYIESMVMPYVCDACDYETMQSLSRGVEYDYATATQPSFVKIPNELECPKCKSPKSFEADFLVEKTFAFLKGR